jgi:hypothetical protein
VRRTIKGNLIVTDATAPETQQLPPCSIPPTCQISFRNIPEDAEWKDKFIAVIQKLAETTGRYMNLSNLDGITIGFDYDDALASVDLGYESTIAKQYTKQENLLGVGKVLRVRRNTQGVETSVLGAVDRARSAIKEYRTHSDVARLLVETAREIAMPLKMSAYLLGHLDGLDEEADIDSRCHFAGELTPHFHELLDALRGAWGTREAQA